MTVADVKAKFDAWSMERFSTWLKDVPQVQFKLVAVIGLDYLTFFWIAGSSAFSWWTIQELVLGAWLTFLGALNGIGYYSYKTQRDTDYGALERKADIERAKASAPAPVTATTVAPPGATTTTTTTEDQK